MKSAFGATLIFQIVIVFVIIFTGYICISINQSKAFNMKNEIVKAVERFAPDLDKWGFQDYISTSLAQEGYRSTGDCSRIGTGYTAYNENGIASGTDEGAFCIAEVQLPPSSELPGSYYKIVTFYQLEIPILQSLFQLKATGETKIIYGS